MNSQRPPQILRGWISDMTESAIQTKYSTLHTDAAGTKELTPIRQLRWPDSA